MGLPEIFNNAENLFNQGKDYIKQGSSILKDLNIITANDVNRLQDKIRGIEANGRETISQIENDRIKAKIKEYWPYGAVVAVVIVAIVFYNKKG